jgi:hypothetical protein
MTTDLQKLQARHALQFCRNGADQLVIAKIQGVYGSVATKVCRNRASKFVVTQRPGEQSQSEFGDRYLDDKMVRSYMTFIKVREPSSDGSGPVRELPETTRLLRFVSRPITVGKGPVSLFDER